MMQQNDQDGSSSEVNPGVYKVPEDLLRAGHDTNVPQADSPETLDEAISTGDNREEIDPDHSITRPEITTTDEEELGAN